MNVNNFLNGDNNTYRKLAYRFPHLVERAIDICDYSVWETKIVLENGDIYLFDEGTENVRRLPGLPGEANEKEFMCEFGIRLRNIMRWNRITQSQLSEKSGISQPRISQYATGQATPSIYTVNRLAKALGCSVDELVY